MKFLSSHGMKMPALGFGTWRLSGENCSNAVRAALKIGYRHIDTAQAYDNETEVGYALADCGIVRENLFVTTKVWVDNAAPDDVISSTEESLRKLNLDYVNLLLLHWPSKTVPLAETLSAMLALLRAGKTQAIGVSNFPVVLMRELVERFRLPIACNQVEYHALLSQEPVLSYARAHDIIVTAYSPLARAELAKHPVLQQIGAKYGKTASQIALRWLIDQPGVAIIPKAADMQHIKANYDLFGFELAEDDRRKINALQGNHRIVNPAWAPEWDQVA